MLVVVCCLLQHHCNCYHVLDVLLEHPPLSTDNYEQMAQRLQWQTNKLRRLSYKNDKDNVECRALLWFNLSVQFSVFVFSVQVQPWAFDLQPPSPPRLTHLHNYWDICGNDRPYTLNQNPTHIAMAGTNTCLHTILRSTSSFLGCYHFLSYHACHGMAGFLSCVTVSLCHVLIVVTWSNWIYSCYHVGPCWCRFDVRFDGLFIVDSLVRFDVSLKFEIVIVLVTLLHSHLLSSLHVAMCNLWNPNSMDTNTTIDQINRSVIFGLIDRQIASPPPLSLAVWQWSVMWCVSSDESSITTCQVGAIVVSLVVNLKL